MQNHFNSVSDRKWSLIGIEERLIDKLVQDLEISDFLARIVSSRSNSPFNSVIAKKWLDPKLKFDLPSPFVLKDIDKAVERIIDAYKRDEQITVFGDYDVDGATSSALIFKFFKMFGKEINIYIPDRIKEGYGPNVKAIENLKNNGTKLLITVDCGITSFKEIEYANKLGLDTIVIDHHSPESSLPNAYAIINPNRLDDESELGMLAAVGVSFMFVRAIKSKLLEKNIIKDNFSNNLMQLLDLVALGTICDVVPLLGPNRALVKQGLQFMSLMNNKGIKMLYEILNIQDFPSVYHAGFLLGPRINAGGRVGKSELGVNLLITENAQEAKNISNELEKYNQDRKRIEEEVFIDAKGLVQKEENSNILILSGKNWHNGVIGIVASRVAEQFNKPTIIISTTDKECKGSARSISGINIGKLITAAKQKGLLINGGGHPMAGGITIEYNKIDEFKSFLNNQVKKNISDSNERIKWIDLSISVSGLNIDLYKELSRVEPFGAGNPEPRFLVSNASIFGSRIVGEKHVSCSVTDSTKKRINAIAFRSVGTKLGNALLNKNYFHVIGKLKLSEWNGKERLQMFIEDLIEI